jgi:undecaprenyl-diphosphatase
LLPGGILSPNGIRIGTIKIEEGDLMLQLDYRLFQIINGWAASCSFLNPLMRFLAEDAEYVFMLGVVMYWLTRKESNRRMIAEALLSACLGLGVSGLIGHFFYRDRPFVTHAVLQLIKHPANASFPSDHAVGAFVIASAIWLYRKRDGTAWYVLASFIAFSRIWTGVHYPSDVVAGAVIGIAAAACVHQLSARWGYARKGMQTIIGAYERIEYKVWPRKNENMKVTKRA